MKKYLFLFLVVSFYASLHAQGLGFLKNEVKVSMRLNYSEAAIAGFDEGSILGFEEDWEIDQPVLFAKMAENYNKKMGTILPAGNFSNTNYVIEVRPLVIQKNGNMVSYFVVFNADGEELYKSGNLKAKGGTFGTFLNLVGDGMKSTGKVVAAALYKELKR